MITGLDSKTAHQIVEGNRCAECGGGLIDPYGGSYGYPGQYIVRCLANIEHHGFKKMGQTRVLADGREYNIMTQQPIDEIPQPLVVPQTLPAMQARVREAISTGILASDSFSSNLTPAQQLVVAKVALAYGLDPLMGELAILHGKPYPTIKAKRRKHAEATHQPSITFRALHDWEMELYKRAGDLKDEDLALVCVMTRENGMVVEHFAKVTREERDERSKGGDKYASPVVRANPVEMVQKRAESGAWEKAYGPIGIPKLFEDMLLEAFSGAVIEGQLVSDTVIPWCDDHNMAFQRNVSQRDGHVWYSHRQQDAPRGYHNATEEQNARFEGLSPQGASPDKGRSNPDAQATGSQPEQGEAPADDTGEGPLPPHPITGEILTKPLDHNDVFGYAQELGYPPQRVPTILGSSKEPVTLPQWLAAGHSHGEAMVRIREYHQMDKGGRAR